MERKTRLAACIDCNTAPTTSYRCETCALESVIATEEKKIAASKKLIEGARGELRKRTRA